jgi:hypothetical protein
VPGAMSVVSIDASQTSSWWIFKMWSEQKGRLSFSQFVGSRLHLCLVAVVVFPLFGLSKRFSDLERVCAP